MPTAFCSGALNLNGLISWYAGAYMITTGIASLDGARIGNTAMYYRPEVDRDGRYIERTVGTPFGEIRVPTAERAISESLIHMDVTEEGLLAEAIIEYSNIHHGDLRKLHQVAREYNVDEALTQWIHDIEEQDRIKLE